MTTPEQSHTTQGSAKLPASPPKLSGDERFVPASHVLVADQQVSHPAFRLWCVLHRLWFLRELPAMELLQNLMGTFVVAKNKAPAQNQPAKLWQPATRRSIERWLSELEAAGWLVWTRREEASRRYHLRTSAQSAGDAAVLTELRTLLNSGKATLSDIQALLAPSEHADDATPESHDAIQGSLQDGEKQALADIDATAESQAASEEGATTTTGSHDATAGSHATTAESHHATTGSHHTTAKSHHAILSSQGGLDSGVPMPEKTVPKHEIRKSKDSSEEITPPPPAAAGEGDGGGGPTTTERYLLRQGFSARVAHELRLLDHLTVQADFERRTGLGQGIGAIVTVWRITPPQPEPRESAAPPAEMRRAVNAKAEALALAPANASPLDIQYLALDLEEGLAPAAALARLAERGSALAAGGGR